MNQVKCCLLLGVCLGLGLFFPAQAASSQASGGGTYFVKPGILSEFQLSESHVQCKIGYGVLDDGTVLQMWMFSTNIDSVSVNSAAQTVDITGTMISIVTLHFTDGTSAHQGLNSVLLIMRPAGYGQTRGETSSTPGPAHQPANFPSTTIAGSLRTPYCFAFAVAASLCITISHDR